MLTKYALFSTYSVLVGFIDEHDLCKRIGKLLPEDSIALL